METLTPADVTAIVPVLNEVASIGGVVSGLLLRGIGPVIVVDGGSTDGSVFLARAAGALVVIEPRRGYGNACLAGVAAAGTAPLLLFLDGDGAEDLDGAIGVVRCLIEQQVDLVLGARVVAAGEEGAQTRLAVLGNRFCSWWLRTAFGAPISDLPSMKAIRREAYMALQPNDRAYGWTAQLLARAARRRLRIVELPVAYRRRTGHSKVSGTLRGALRAGCQTLAAIGRESAGALVAAALRHAAQGLAPWHRGAPNARGVVGGPGSPSVDTVASDGMRGGTDSSLALGRALTLALSLGRGKRGGDPPPNLVPILRRDATPETTKARPAVKDGRR